MAARVELSKLVKEKKFWAASLLVTWAAALQGHMMWMQRQDSFKHKFGDANAASDSDSRNTNLADAHSDSGSGSGSS